MFITSGKHYQLQQLRKTCAQQVSKVSNAHCNKIKYLLIIHSYFWKSCILPFTRLCNLAQEIFHRVQKAVQRIAWRPVIFTQSNWSQIIFKSLFFSKKIRTLGSKGTISDARILQNRAQNDPCLSFKCLLFSICSCSPAGLLSAEQLSAAIQFLYHFLTSWWLFVCMGAELFGFNGHDNATCAYHSIIRSNAFFIDGSRAFCLTWHC